MSRLYIVIYRCNEIIEIIKVYIKVLMNWLFNIILILNHQLNNKLDFIMNIKYNWRINLILKFNELVLNIYKLKYIN